ncbi:pyridoxamine 5'-phosphate oxidase family protein [Streptomyces sp. GMY02]|uniref:pyridoxamine 5'-phosphate oxidase family protein n=1 Tax=Streptomyces sp. GMY02 TaxID=1333528 RepID=UPI001C2C9F5C|nr:pyridoxamine 5'-phosphate oxidase family protein [Streptomyces sp. GMY02]QXE37385.1 pyridoxamine 5'-phosphate oxidase family protein [Streptomyces sp. GMY02]
MTFTWPEFRSAEPDFAETVQRRFETFPHHVLATLRKDGSPRLSGLEVTFRFGELWLGMMPNSRKALDLLRDPRFALHANPGDGNTLPDGDVRIGGLAVEVTDDETLGRFTEEVRPPEPFHLFRVEPTEVVRTWLEDGALAVRVWHPGRPLRTLRHSVLG